jgi:hypothetical protein
MSIFLVFRRQVSFSAAVLRDVELHWITPNQKKQTSYSIEHIEHRCLISSFQEQYSLQQVS